MRTYQIDPQYLPALGDALVMRSENEQTSEVMRLSEMDTAALAADKTGAYSLEVGDLKSGEESAANLNFRDQGTLSMRVWIRVAVTVVPIVLLLLALYIQRKKFIIDEDYYDMMLREIDKRNAPQA